MVEEGDIKQSKKQEAIIEKEREARFAKLEAWKVCVLVRCGTQLTMRICDGVLGRAETQAAGGRGREAEEAVAGVQEAGEREPKKGEVCHELGNLRRVASLQFLVCAPRNEDHDSVMKLISYSVLYDPQGCQIGGKSPPPP